MIQGLLQAHESVIVSKDNVAQLFAHEATRVFHDRLICAEDRDTFFQFLSDTLHDHFKVIYSRVIRMLFILMMKVELHVEVSVAV